MALLYNSEPMAEVISLGSVDLSFLYDYEQPVKVQQFYTNEYILDDVISFELKENKPVSILFQANDNNARFYMYGLESLSNENLEIDENGDVFLQPSAIPIVLYAKDYYPLIPGSYLAKVITGEFTYYLPFTVRPKQVTDDQLKLMKEELEDVVKGLAIDFVKKVYSPADNDFKALPPHLLRQFMTIKKHYPSVMAALTDIYKKANYRIKKDYRWTRENRASQVDHVTVRTAQTKSFYEDQLLTPFSSIDYDLPENRWVKFIIRNVLTLLNQFVDSLDNYNERVINELKELQRFQFQESTRRELVEKERVTILLEDYRQLVHRMKIGFQMIVHASWYQEITNKTFTHIPHNLLSDSRYRALFQLHRDLNDDELEVTIDPAFTYQWKRTDKLYEMWGFLQILKLLRDFGFQPISGWVFDQAVQEDKILLIPYLPSGEQIVLSKGDLLIHYVYDGVLPLASSGTNLERAPLYMGKHNRPDGRMDFYKNEVYVGSLIIDFKYRPINNFWKNGKYNSMSRLGEMEQLIAYKRDSNSKYLYGEEKGRHIRELLSPRPVREVWALYAEARDEWQSHLHLIDDSIRIIPMNPGQEYSAILEHLQAVIEFMDGMLDRIL
ncbi:DUF2357 domain-containing protein [Paenibacillus sp. Root444D2]|uniref:DUF2357 domain-containing protein n=1 Tax=Paenibacillus sp. Root444D2 TaxID=1736538 RepID=UPI000710CA45|nr:DUF2357 domain-containing protein [Paenibacillus sp. Root444D2]KQX45868.1 hypothetical protein ASD40_18710 [Paenibacillus sp. Root444D2]